MLINEVPMYFIFLNCHYSILVFILLNIHFKQIPFISDLFSSASFCTYSMFLNCSFIFLYLFFSFWVINSHYLLIYSFFSCTWSDGSLILLPFKFLFEIISSYMNIWIMFFFKICFPLNLMLSRIKFRLLILLVLFHFEIYLLFFISFIILVCRFILSSKISLFSLSFFSGFLSSSMVTYHYVVTLELPASYI